MAEKLTPQQQMAVDDRGGNLLVSAAAGSGKTKVLVDRLLKYICDPTDPANIDEFLIITYTKAAASELRVKIAGKLTERIAEDPGNRHLQRQLQRLYLTKISTVHSFCTDILREYAYLLDISADFAVADEELCRQLRERVMQQILEDAYQNIGSDPDFQAFVDTQGLGRSDTLVPQIIEQVYDSAMCHTDPDKWCDRCMENAQTGGITDPAQTEWGKYLMNALFACLDGQIAALTACAEAVENMEDQAKPAALLRDTVNQLVHLRQSQSWNDVLARKNIDYGKLIFRKKTDDPSVSEPVKAVRKACKDQLAKQLAAFSDPAEQVLADLTDCIPAARSLMKLVRRFRQEYSRQKRRRRVLDFSDLEHKALDLLLGKSRSGRTAAAAEIEQRYREIMVDEYQDSNGVQDAIFSALTQTKQNLFMVGDVKQSIYQFRLADPQIFMDKYARYADAAAAQKGQGRKVLLSSNFRSGTGVIEAVNYVFDICMSEAVGGIRYTDAEALREGVPHIALNEPETELHCIRVQGDTYGEEAAFVADRICQLTDGEHYVRQGDSLRPITLEDVVILLRSPGSVGIAYVNALAQRGIRCASGSGTDLFLTPEVGTLRSLLQVISNPRQDIPLVAALASPVFGFTADDLAALRGVDRSSCIYDCLTHSTDTKALRFLEILRALRTAAAMGTMSELLERIFNLTRLDTVYAAIGGDSAKENLQAFFQLAVDYSAMGGGDLDRFLEHLESMEERGLLTASHDPSDCVTLMSIHKSKGLEFPVVFLCGLSKQFNTSDSKNQVLCHKEMGLGLSCVDTANRIRYPSLSKAAIAARITSEGISEELRVLYVAMTRARDRLIMTYSSDSLDKDITDIALTMDICSREMMTREVKRAGTWVLYSALHRTEAGELFAIGGKPQAASVADRPWLIKVWDGTAGDAQPELTFEEEKPAAPSDAVLRLREALSFRYAHSAATATPSKQTATQRKGRVKDQEAEEQSGSRKLPERTWREPAFRAQKVKGTTYGSAVHAALQYLRYDCCGSPEAVCRELERLVAQKYITAEQAGMVDCEGIARFFATDLGFRLRNSKHVLREFKFSILDDASQYGADLEGERVLLQGVVDCALVEPDGITVVDFKTDYVTRETVEIVTARYAPQVQTYADALSRIYQLPIKAKALYYFHIHSFIWL